MNYLYDFGDGWRHRIEYEAIFFKNDKQNYPVCLAGERRAPPEDCGGIGGYEDLLEILQDPGHEEYQSMRRWVGKTFHPEKFEASKVRFDDPQKRWKIAFQSKK